MKYQDLCIKLSEVLRAKGINTIYFEDVNLLNSEDVIYPAAVMQLVRVEQESHSDRYTIMVTIAKKRQDATNENGTQWINIDKGLTWQNGSMTAYGMLLFEGNRSINELQVFGSPFAAGNYKFSYSSVDASNRSCVAYFSQYDTPAVTAQTTQFYRRMYPHTSYIFTIRNYTRVTVDFETSNIDFETRRNAITLEQEVSVVRDSTPNVFEIRGVTDILANDERIQINSCVTTPFRWKFRDEVEGITAEINLSLFFDNNCN